MSLKSIREQVNIWLFGHKSLVLGIAKSLSIAVSILAVITLVYYYGFPQTPDTETVVFTIIKSSFGYYVFHYLLRVVYDFKPKQFLRATWFEGVLMGLLVLEGISHLFFGVLLVPQLFEQIGIHVGEDITTIAIQLYFAGAVVVALTRASSFRARFPVHPALIFIASFLILIGIGTGLLMLPEMTNTDSGMNFVDALFTSTSASCVTGLMVEDTPTFFTFKGQVVLLILIKLGGLNIIAFASFLALAGRLGFRIKQHDVLEDFINRDSFLSTKNMFGKVVLWSAGIEVLGAVAMYFVWDKDMVFASQGEHIFYSVFHSVSAFNNAGISLFTDGIANAAVANNYLLHWVITVLVFFGALGMLAIFDLFDPSKLRDRLKHPWKQIGFATKIALYFSLWLVVIGAGLFFILEQDGTLADKSLFGQITTSFFQSATRTSGFNTVDIGMVGVPMLFILMILMFIGGSSSSTSGGIKTSTFAIVSADVWSTIRGHNYTHLFKRTITTVLKSRAYSVLMFFIVGNLLFAFVLCITEAHILEQEGRTIMDILFEQVSALGTVGLSTGITSELSTVGKGVISLSMFVGRVGTLTVAFALAGKLISKNYKFPDGHTLVG